ncbi:MAG TPA: FtsW/RodA/SpoVE family cell cycle protein, partial [Acidimicrobiales bacterium]|nr:FtsW/RodA/SpoVE family cell cycle protein [Acidimicrobiales bacterium]
MTLAQFVVDRRFARPLWRRRLAHLDVALVATTLVVSGIGVLMVYTATRGDLLHAGSSPTHFLKRQAMWSLAGLVVMVVVAAIDYHRFERLAYPLYGLLIVGLLGIFAV